jgi:oxygen-dependent protoporphyrinogen oxidase
VARRVIVVGAGLAGLGAAWRLRRLGCAVALLERSPRAGGRAAGEWVEGFAVERSLPLVGRADRRMVSWIAALGVGDELLPLRPVALEQACRGAFRAVDPGTLPGLLRTPGLRKREALRALRFPRLLRRYRRRLDPEVPESAAFLDDRSVADFARLYFGASALDRWIAPAIASSTAGEPEDLSRAAFLRDWLRVEGGRLGIPRRGLHELARAAAVKLGPRLGAAAEAVEASGSGLRVHCAGGRLADATLEADAVVLAVPAAEAARLAAPLLSPAERDLLPEVGFRPAMVLSVALEQPPGPRARRILVPASEGSAVATLLAEPGAADGRAPERAGLLTLAATARFAEEARREPDDAAAKSLLAALERLAPRMARAARFARLERSLVPRFEVGSYRRMARFADVQADLRARGRRLYFAGDWLAGPSAEDALASGWRAADALVSDLSR